MNKDVWEDMEFKFKELHLVQEVEGENIKFRGKTGGETLTTFTAQIEYALITRYYFKDYAAKINNKATDLGLDLKNNFADFKKLKTEARDIWIHGLFSNKSKTFLKMI